MPAPEDEDVLRIATLVGQRVQSLLRRRGLGTDSDADAADALSRDEPGLAAIYSTSVRSRIASGPNAGNRIVALGDQIDGDSLESLHSPRCATVSGFSVHANVSIGANDRMRLERLARYVARPAISTERLSELPDGRLLYRLKRRWRNGTTEVVFERNEFIAKLAALVPAPRAHLARYHGILAPAAEWRPLVVPKPDVPFGPCSNPYAEPESAPDLKSEPEATKYAPPPRRKATSHSDFFGIWELGFFDQSPILLSFAKTDSCF